MTVLRTTVDELAREHNEAAIATLAEVMTSTMAEDKDRIRAAEALLDRGNGKPVQAVIQIPAARAKRALLASKSDDELMAIIEEAPLPSLLQEPAAPPVPRQMLIESKPAPDVDESPADVDEFVDPLLL